MNKLYLTNNPIVFQGESILEKNTTYFEGWYFKNCSNDFTISFIPGINSELNKKSCFIQIITNKTSYYIPYDIKDFKFSYDPFSIEIGKNYFSENKIIIDISYNKLRITGTLLYSNNIPLQKTRFSPNIMGPFSFIPFMECNHAILSLKHNINGNLKINNTLYHFNNGIGYIEKDWGKSFPKKYLWCEGNSFPSSNSSFFLSIAKIPFKLFTFTGFICVFYLNGKEYKFTTYNNSNIEICNIENNFINIILKKNNYKISLVAKYNNSLNLLAPQNGNMCIHISESIDSEIEVTLLENDSIIFKEKSKNCGIEIRE